VVVVLVLRRAGRDPARPAAGNLRHSGADALTRLTALGLARAGIVFGAASAFPFLVTADWIVNIGVFTLMYAGLATAWNLFSGYTGYISLGQAAFFGIGAYALAITFNHLSIGSGYRPFYVLPLIGLAVGLASVPVAWVALRTRAMTFAIVTLMLLFIVQQLAFNLRSLTHGSQGIAVPQPSFSSNFDRPYYFAMLGVLALAMAISWYVRGSKLGLQLLAVREDEEKARGLGVRVTEAKLIAWALSVALTAMIGGIWGYYLFFVYPESAVDPLVMIGAVLMAFLGGKGTLWGPAIGALVLVPAQQWALTDFGATRLYLIAYALVFVVILLILPRGIVPSLRRS
jgi:branched-chain amino acid transport system permease protein